MIIEGFPTYHIFKNGAILSEGAKFNKPRFLKHSKNTYLAVSLYDKDRKQHVKRIHRLLAEHFIPNPNNYNCVDHIDGNKWNNKLSNLRWCTKAMNNGYNNHPKNNQYTKGRI